MPRIRLGGTIKFFTVRSPPVPSFPRANRQGRHGPLSRSRQKGEAPSFSGAEALQEPRRPAHRCELKQGAAGGRQEGTQGTCPCLKEHPKILWLIPPRQSAGAAGREWSCEHTQSWKVGRGPALHKCLVGRRMCQSRMAQVVGRWSSEGANGQDANPGRGVTCPSLRREETPELALGIPRPRSHSW